MCSNTHFYSYLHLLRLTTSVRRHVTIGTRSCKPGKTCELQFCFGLARLFWYAGRQHVCVVRLSLLPDGHFVVFGIPEYGEVSFFIVRFAHWSHAPVGQFPQVALKIVDIEGDADAVICGEAP